MRRLAVLAAVLLLVSVAPLPAAGGGAKVDTIRDFDSVAAVAFADNELGVLLMNMHCDFVRRVELPDGTSQETMSCRITGAEGLGDLGGTLPETTFKEKGGECVWFSDYWFQTDGSEVYADSFSQQVMPSGQVHVTARYGADPLTAEECGFTTPPPG